MLQEMFSTVRFRAMAALCAMGIVLSGCASQVAYDNSLSPAQNQLRQSNARFNQTVGEGAVAGALVGGLAGLAFGGRDRAGAAAVGAGAGAALGAGAGYLVARNNLSRSSTEAQYADAIQQAAADADAFRSSADASRQVADQAFAEAGRLRSQMRAGQISQAQYRSQLAKFQGDQEIMSSQVEVSRQRAAQLRQDASISSGANRARLSSAASDIEQSTTRIEQDRSRLSRVLAGDA